MAASRGLNTAETSWRFPIRRWDIAQSGGDRATKSPSAMIRCALVLIAPSIFPAQRPHELVGDGLFAFVTARPFRRARNDPAEVLPHALEEQPAVPYLQAFEDARDDVPVFGRAHNLDDLS
jgi:hypothetical protein